MEKDVVFAEKVRDAPNIGLSIGKNPNAFRNVLGFRIVETKMPPADHNPFYLVPQDYSGDPHVNGVRNRSRRRTTTEGSRAGKASY